MTPSLVRPMRIARRVALWSTLPLALAGCHIGGGSEPPSVTVRIYNDLVPASGVSVSLLPASGARRTIGVVGPGRTEELRFPVGSSEDPHRLLAEAGSGPAYVSRVFTLSTAATVEWRVGQNILNVSTRR